MLSPTQANAVIVDTLQALRVRSSPPPRQSQHLGRGYPHQPPGRIPQSEGYLRGAAGGADLPYYTNCEFSRIALTSKGGG
eukprot:8281457-Pyramimonas_sp.AAC.2